MPERLLVLGGVAVGCELAFDRLLAATGRRPNMGGLDALGPCSSRCVS